MGNRVGRAIKAVATGYAVTQLKNLVATGLEYASSLKEQADQLGVSSTALQEYRYAASQAGVSNEEMDTALSQLTKRIGEAAQGTKAQAEAFAKLGITVKDTNGNVLNAADAIPKIADALAKIKSPAERAALLMDLFGKAGQKLEPLLAGGSRSVNELRDAAHKLGIVLSEQQIQNADDTADKISALNQALSARIAGAVADNATSIYRLADSLATLFARAIDFIKTYPRLSAALAGAAAGGALGGGPGAAIGGVAGFTGASVASASSYNAAIAEQKRRYARAQANIAGRSNLTAAQKRTANEVARREIDKQLGIKTERVGPFGLMKTTVNPPATPASNTPDPAAVLGTPDPESLPKPAKTKTAHGPSAEEIQKRFNDDLVGYAQQAISARQSLATSAEEEADLGLKAVEFARLRSTSDIKLNKDYSDAQKQRLLLEVEGLADDQRASIEREKTRRLEDEADDVARQESASKKDRLQLQLGLADTDKERQDIALQLLDLDQQERRQALERVANSTVRSDAERALAKRGLDQLNATSGLERSNTMRANETRAQTYLRTLKQTPGQVDEAFDGIAIDGLERLNDGLADAITGARSLGEAFKNVANQIISDLARIAIRQAITAPLANALFGGGSGGGGLGGLLGGLLGGSKTGSSLASAFDAAFPAHANGTNNAPGGLSLVGERGPELVRLRRGSQVFNNADTRRLLAGGGNTGGIVNNYYGPGAQEFWGKIAQGNMQAAQAGAYGGMALGRQKQSRRLA